MATTILKPSEFDIKNLTYGDVIERKNGSKVCYPLYNKKPLYFQTPQMYAPFGISTFNNDGGKPEDYSMNLSFQGMNERKSLKAFYDMLEQIDKANIQEGFKNCSSWLNKKKVNSTDVVEALYTPIIREATSDKYSSTFKLKLPYYDDMFKTQFYDKTGEVMNIKNYLNGQTKGSKCKAVIMCAGIWLIGGKFGCTWQCVQMECVMPEKLSGYVIKNIEEDNIDNDDIPEDVDGDEDTDTITNDVGKIDIKSKEEDSGENIESDDPESDDDDDDDDDGDEPVPVIVKKKSKK